MIESNLYHMLHQHTKGSTAERIVSATRSGSLDQYRVLYFEGMHVSDHALFLVKGRVWKVTEAKKHSDFASAVDSWEQDRDFLARHTKYAMSVSDQQYALLSICPPDLRKEILREYSEENFPSYLRLKQHIMNLIQRDRDIQSQSLGRGLHEVGKKKGKKTEGADENWSWEEWPEGGWGEDPQWQSWEGQEQEESAEDPSNPYVGAL